MAMITAAAAAAAAAATVVFTTPPNYADRLSILLKQNGNNPIWCPTISTEVTSRAVDSLSRFLSPPSVFHLSGIAFPSRTAITATSAAISMLHKPILTPSGDGDCEPFFLAALGRDADMIDSEYVNRFGAGAGRVKLIVPPVATPSALVESLGLGCGRRILCPVPLVLGLNEPPVVPRFLRDLENAGWVAIRVEAYETWWMGPTCAETMVREIDNVDAVVFTSTAEVEGLLKSLRDMGWDWAAVKRRRPRLVAAAHGPVTAAGAESFGVTIDVVSSRFGSFEGVVDALGLRLQDSG